MEQVVWILLETTDFITGKNCQAGITSNTSANKKRNTMEKKKFHEDRNSEKYGFKALKSKLN